MFIIETIIINKLYIFKGFVSNSISIKYTFESLLTSTFLINLFDVQSFINFKENKQIVYSFVMFYFF